MRALMMQKSRVVGMSNTILRNNLNLQVSLLFHGVTTLSRWDGLCLNDPYSYVGVLYS